MRRPKITDIGMGNCQKFKHVLPFLGLAFGVFVCSATQALGQANDRSPASANYRQNMVDAPPEMPTPYINRLLIEDEKGVLRSLKEQTEKWNHQEQMAENWNMESSGLYDTPSDQEKGLYYKKSFLKYFEKKFLGEAKRQGKTIFAPSKARNKEKGSQDNGQENRVGVSSTNDTAQSTDNIKKVLAPTASADITKNSKLKMRLRPLQGRVFFVLQNPFVDTEVKLSVKRDVVMNLNKNFEKVGLGTSVNYQVTQKMWSTQINKTITESVSAQVSSSQKASDGAFSEASAKALQVVYSIPF